MIPPAHYEYNITIDSDGAGVINFYPDYPQFDQQAWVEHFKVSKEDCHKLHNLLAENNLFRQTWTEIQDAPVGGSLEWLDITADKVEYNIPSIIEESSVVEEVYEAIRSLVPIKIWKKLISQREDFIRDYSDE